MQDALRGWRGGLALSFVCAFTVLGLLVVNGTTLPFEGRVLARLRPDGVWGPTQFRYGPWMSRLAPPRMYLLLGGVALGAAAWRRSWWPAVYGSVLVMASVTLTLALKAVFHRPDPHGYLPATGGAFPSGHMVAVLVCLGGCLLLASPRVRWWCWVPVAAAAALMATALLVSTAHWPSDVAGGVLLALAILTAASSLPLRRRACPRGP